MKVLIPIALLLALLGCESDPPAGSQNSAKGVAREKAASYVDEKTLRGMINQRGLYKLVRSGGLIDDPSTSTGKAVWKPVIELVKSTDRIPLLKGAQMYLQYRIWYLPDQPAYIDLRRVLKHPAMTLPDGKVSTGSDYIMKGRVRVNQAIGYTGYGFDEDYELVEGDWIFEIWHQDQKMIEQKFTTYRPDKEEIAALEPLLALGNKVVGQGQSPKKPSSRFDWPRKKITTGENQVPEPTGSSNGP